MYTCSIQRFKFLVCFCSWPGWFESYLDENFQRHIFSWCGSNGNDKHLLRDDLNLPFINEDGTKYDNDFGAIQYKVVEIGVTGDGRYLSMQTAIYDTTKQPGIHEHLWARIRAKNVIRRLRNHRIATYILYEILVNLVKFVVKMKYKTVEQRKGLIGNIPFFWFVFKYFHESQMSHVTRKPVFGVCDQTRLKPACSAIETS